MTSQATKRPTWPPSTKSNQANTRFTAAHHLSWAAIAAASLAAAVFGSPAAAAAAAVPFGLAATVGGYLLGCLVPAALQGVLHPVVVTAVIGNAGVALLGSLQGLTYQAAQKAYLAKVRRPRRGALL